LFNVIINDGGCGLGGKHTKIKIEGATTHACYVDPLYGAKPNIIFDRKIEFFQTSFLEKYGISNQGIALKRLKIGKEIEEEEVEALFRPYNHNGCRYFHNEDKAFISRVKTLWMIMHQRTQVPNIQMINKVEAHGIAYEIKMWKKVNWHGLVEWTIRDQLRKLQSLESILQCGKLGFVTY
jgi:hypothetical protein